jgi:hypothetical protein
MVALAVLGTVGTAPPHASASPIYPSVVLADNPVGYWRLGESPAQTTAFDSSPFMRNGTYMGAVTRGVPGAIVDDPDTAAQFAGGFVAIPGGPFNLANNFSLEAWVINNNTGPFVARIFSNRLATPLAAGYGFGVLPDGRLRFTTFGILDYDSAVVVPQDGNYHHVVVTFDPGNDAHFYLDGTFRETVFGTLPAQSSSSDLNIGRNPVVSPITGSFEPWNGAIDEAAIYNYVLSAAQVAAHYQAGIAPAAIPEPGSLLLFGLGALGLLGCAWRRRGRVAQAGHSV